MNIAKLLTKLRDEQTLGAGQAARLLDLHEKRIYSVHRELRLYLYAGMLLLITGAGLTVKQYFVHLGDLVIITALTLCFAAAFVYCFVKGRAFDRGQAASPNLAFDYILFFGCALFAMDIAYIETQFSVLGDGWKNYLLISVALFFLLSYRFDNRLVLSMALSTLAAWFGFTLSAHQFFSFADHFRFYAIAYALIVFGAGGLCLYLGVKKHFFGIYLNFSIHFLCGALLAGIADRPVLSLYFFALISVCALIAFYAVRVRLLLYMLYAVVYGYIGLSLVVVDWNRQAVIFTFAYFIITSLLVIGLIFKMSRIFKEHDP
ncbi:MAG: hypothetical protein R6W75_12910 [Smithellaceae bacterium]